MWSIWGRGGGFLRRPDPCIHVTVGFPCEGGRGRTGNREKGRAKFSSQAGLSETVPWAAAVVGSPTLCILRPPAPQSVPFGLFLTVTSSPPHPLHLDFILVCSGGRP